MNKENKGLKAAEMLSDFANSARIADREEFVKAVTSEHRTLQQEMFNLFIDCIEEWSKQAGTDRFDLRNQYAVNKSKEIMDKVILHNYTK